MFSATEHWYCSTHSTMVAENMLSCSTIAVLLQYPQYHGASLLVLVATAALLVQRGRAIPAVRRGPYQAMYLWPDRPFRCVVASYRARNCTTTLHQLRCVYGTAYQVALT
eukprot:6212358-Pleurochrysis_carterae.AAC.2